MRTVYRICAFMTLFAVLANTLGVLAIWGKISSNDIAGLSTLNWSLLQPIMVISCVVLLIGGSGVITIATADDAWKSMVKMDKIKKEQYQKILEVNELRDKLAIAVLKYEQKNK